MDALANPGESINCPDAAEFLASPDAAEFLASPSDSCAPCANAPKSQTASKTVLRRRKLDWGVNDPWLGVYCREPNCCNTGEHKRCCTYVSTDCISAPRWKRAVGPAIT
eukprot:gnl/MRDRNA2_/MRDRNA2_322343_c0_seq1.p1 gnl/MRDRNA2_/MRDRNA2_322343_c0~~gnl/MRDRNA2_/MRDRNA2_322343_c0_seq1.p1  ORF type:complete len:109 (-),score=7.32 gnl/MRDRNA2_/MRDRNA2_322343_c0_seq1:249-575(-)